MELANEIERLRPDGVGAFIGVKSLPLVRLKDRGAPCRPPLAPFGPGAYAVVGELGKTRKYVLLEVRTGKVIPGGWGSNYFERVPEGEEDLDF